MRAIPLKITCILCAALAVQACVKSDEDTKGGGPASDSAAASSSTTDWTLEVIFYGLIALAPSSTHREAIGLLVDGTSSGVTEHVPGLMIYEGICDDDCKRLPIIKKNKGVPTDLHDLGKLDVRLAGLPTTGDFLTIGARPGVFPGTAEQTKSLGWIPQLNKISPEASSVFDSCLAPGNPTSASPKCPVSSRVRISGWTGAETCHLVHGKGEEEEVEAFVFAPPGTSGGALAQKERHVVADSTMFKWEGLRIPAVILQVRSFGTAGFESIPIKPENKKVTLLFWNQPKAIPPSVFQSHHFEAYYQLTKFKPNLIPSQRHLSTGSVPYLGACESILSTIDKRANKIGFVYAKHNIRECDSTVVSATALPEWK